MTLAFRVGRCSVGASFRIEVRSGADTPIRVVAKLVDVESVLTGSQAGDLTAQFDGVLQGEAKK